MTSQKGNNTSLAKGNRRGRETNAHFSCLFSSITVLCDLHALSSMLLSFCYYFCQEGIFVYATFHLTVINPFCSWPNTRHDDDAKVDNVRDRVFWGNKSPSLLNLCKFLLVISISWSLLFGSLLWILFFYLSFFSLKRNLLLLSSPSDILIRQHLFSKLPASSFSCIQSFLLRVIFSLIFLSFSFFFSVTSVSPSLE